MIKLFHVSRNNFIWEVCLEDGGLHFGLSYEINEVDPQGNKIDNVCIM
jgi:hypothetical protein